MNKIVLDTNVLLVSVSDRSQYHWIFKSLLRKEFILCITTDILLEYAEIINRFMGVEASESILGVIENLSNVEKITKYYQFGLLEDPDDDKFVDCAIASNADYIVSQDKDFDILQKIEFPRVNVINIKEFKILLNQI